MIILSKKKLKFILGFFVAALVILILIENSGKLIYPLKYKEYVYRYSYQNGIDPYLVFAIIKAESNFDPNATSPKNARGLMQITDKTGLWGADKLKIENFSNQSLYDPETNITIGCWYISRLMREFGGDVDLVITAYNGGSGNVNEWLKNREYSYTGDTLDRIPFKETTVYLKRVKNFYISYKELYGKDV